MQKTRPEKSSLSDALAWVELTYSHLKVDSYLIFVIIGVLIAVMSVGAYQEAVRQASMYLGVVPAQSEPTVISGLMRLMNEYGLAILIGVCYFSNVTPGDRRRELMTDALSIAFGVIIPQLVFHGTWLYTVHELVNTRVPVIGTLIFNAITGEWLITMGLTGALAIALTSAYRLIRRSTQGSGGADMAAMGRKNGR